MSIVSISRLAPASLRMCRVAAMISGPIPSPWATVMGTDLDMLKLDLSRIDRLECEAIYSKPLGTSNHAGTGGLRPLLISPLFSQPWGLNSKARLRHTYRRQMFPCSRASVVTAPVGDREATRVRLKRELGIVNLLEAALAV